MTASLTATREGEPSAPAATDLQTLVDKNADGMVVVDESGIVLFCNEAAAALFGRSTAKLVGSPIGIPMAVGERTEIAIHHLNGSAVEIEMRVVEIRWGGHPARLASLRDMCERRALEEQLRQSQKLEAVGRLTAGVAHDFNNLLTIVLGNLDVAQRRLADGKLHPRVPAAIANALEGARRAATLTHQLLAFARKQPLSPDCVDPNALIEGMTGLLGRTLGEAVRIETRLSEPLWPILIDKSQLESAIINLAVNARDAMDGAGTMVIETTNCDGAGIGRAGAEGDFVCITLSDDGAGIPDDVSPFVFEPFFTTKGVGHGTGLGLSQVYGFVKQSGGYVTLESEVGTGTKVRLYLPRHQPIGRAEEPAPQVPPAEGSRSILLVEDEAAVRDYARHLLEEMGFEVVEAEDAGEALGILRGEKPFDLMFSDIALPGGMDGKELAAEAGRLRPGMKLLLTSACAGEIAPELRFLPKPYSPAALRAALRTLIGRNQAPRVLLVEDDDLVRATMAQALRDAGCKVKEAASARDAQNFLAEARGFDAAVVDIGLPDGSGDSVVAEIKSKHPDMPILVVSGYIDEELHARIGNGSRTVVLEKPFESGTLVDFLRQLGVLGWRAAAS
ncbi:MAG: response regulator [Allosphingosinicella sp.]|uniref:response regulator n=1 Tax=Allosphingosinicella sp. TaxID=2823234 RepID=UPI0039225846